MRVFITGSSRGIGFGIAKVFAEDGHEVILNGRFDAERLRGSAALLNAGYFLADMSDYERAGEVFAEILRGGPLDVLINCAGTEHFGLFTDTRPSDWDGVFNNNLRSVLNACHLAVPGMVRRKSGVIINITSIWGITGASCEAVYSAAKGAVNAFTKSLAKELGPSGVRVNAIACGAFDTRMNERLSAGERTDFIENIPLMRFGQPEEAGKLALYLASGGAGYMTGQIIPLDGGIV